MDLKEYIVHDVKAKDAFHKNLIRYEDHGYYILFEFDTGSVPYYVTDSLADVNFEEIQKNEKAFIVCLNKKSNIDYLIKNWKEYANQKGLIIMFANPDINEKWLINTYMHAQVTEPKDIEKGLKGLFSNVPPVL
jgi:hypothetical protein